MQTDLADDIKDTPPGREADAILRTCVHCGFCNATCPTYQLLGNELDGPRGRIYQIKQVLEGAEVGPRTQLHLDRCLTCRSCETTCPSGVRYGRLLDLGRELVEERVERPWLQRAARLAVRAVLPHRGRFTPLLRLGQSMRHVLPPRLRALVPRRRLPGPWPQARHGRRMLVLDGCVQPAMAPATNVAAARVLDRLGISLLRSEKAGCCGAVSHHLSATEEARGYVRRNIDAWWPFVRDGCEAIVMTASGCGVMVKDYGKLLEDDPGYAGKAKRIAEMTRDLGEVLAAEDLSTLVSDGGERPRVAFHSPCTLQHGQRLNGVVERLLQDLGFELAAVTDPHLCCGSAGTYSLFQPALSRQLRDRKLEALQAGAPALIATANVGCQHHLEGGAAVPVRHWIELVDEALAHSSVSGVEGSP
jgi:glycolate oxidase iron-sulfur subunit